MTDPLPSEFEQLKLELSDLKKELKESDERHHDLHERYWVLKNALQKIVSEEGKVCGEFEVCIHTSCSSSYSAWEISNQALNQMVGKDTYPCCGGAEGYHRFSCGSRGAYQLVMPARQEADGRFEVDIKDKDEQGREGT